VVAGGLLLLAGPSFGSIASDFGIQARRHIYSACAPL
jgi:hypothetical protein